MSFLDRLRGRRRWSMDALTIAGPSIYEALRAAADPSTGRLPANVALPDEPDRATGGLRWAPGALDGVLGHHMGAGDAAPRARAIADAIAALLVEATDERLSALCGLVTDGEPFLGVADALAQELAARRASIDAERLAAVGEHLARRGGRREVVKLGILLLGLVGGGPSHEDLLMTLGAHDELTLFAAVALSRIAGEPALVALARNVDGWGRIQIVERLAETTDRSVAEWLVREGWRNSVMVEYTATICARVGRLAERLAEPGVDGAILVGAAHILQAMIDGRGGPAEGIDDWGEAADGAAAYLARLRDGGGAFDLAHLLAAAKLRNFFDEPDVDANGGWAARLAAGTGGWTAARRSELRAVADEIIGRPTWRALVDAALAGGDPTQMWDADRAACIIGIDTFDVRRQRVRRAPTDAFAWSRLFESAGEARVAEAVALAEELLPLEAIASGPSDELGFGPAYAAHLALEMTLGALSKRARLGWPLVRAALRSPTIRARNLAAGILASWPRDAWPAEATTALETAIAEEPIDDVRARLIRLRDGTPETHEI